MLHKDTSAMRCHLRHAPPTALILNTHRDLLVQHNLQTNDEHNLGAGGEESASPLPPPRLEPRPHRPTIRDLGPPATNTARPPTDASASSTHTSPGIFRMHASRPRPPREHFRALRGAETDVLDDALVLGC